MKYFNIILCLIIVFVITSCAAHKQSEMTYNNTIVEITEVMTNALRLEYKNIKDASVRLRITYPSSMTSLVQLNDKVLYARVVFPCRDYRYSHIIITQFTLYNTVDIDASILTILADRKILENVRNIVCE